MTNIKTILIIDDEYRIREVTKMILEMIAGWTVLTANSGYEGIAIAQSDHPDAIILDMMMPDLDGTQTLARLQGDTATQSIPVLLITAKAMSLEAKQLSNGVKAIIEKPFDPLQLPNTIANALGWY
ncbi:response regulator [Limnofasciculus baicalensis]|uniref:Response regulator n=1 Tax=Limnofasciculus baicalensis BBK-W-15 TaxID=2699891 RepID=A0AAE3GME8_9CYAN|nr:response regulator [Limnofasciculus baicalensis]MCP2727054.1 response regulator [Limnofasciculus baicalensis BBK-W-15]